MVGFSDWGDLTEPAIRRLFVFATDSRKRGLELPGPKRLRHAVRAWMPSGPSGLAPFPAGTGKSNLQEK